MSAHRLEGRAQFLANGIEIDERTIQHAQRFALLHEFHRLKSKMHIYRTHLGAAVIFFAKPRQWFLREKSALHIIGNCVRLRLN